MTPRKTIGVRVDEETESRLSVLADLLAKKAHGAELTTSTVLRVAIDRGLRALERELGVKRKK